MVLKSKLMCWYFAPPTIAQKKLWWKMNPLQQTLKSSATGQRFSTANLYSMWYLRAKAVRLGPGTGTQWPKNWDFGQRTFPGCRQIPPAWPELLLVWPESLPGWLKALPTWLEFLPNWLNSSSWMAGVSSCLDGMSSYLAAVAVRLAGVSSWLAGIVRCEVWDVRCEE